MMKLLLMVVVFLYGLCAVEPLRAQETLLICTNNYEPYYGETLPDFGPVMQITRLAFAAAGYDVSVRFMPWARVLKEAQAGRCDVVAAVWFDTGRKEWMALTDALLMNENGLYKRSSDELVFRGFADLAVKDVVIGTVRGYITPQGLDEAGVLTEEVSADVLNMEKLLKGRIRLALVDKQVGRYLLKKHGKEQLAQWLVTLQKLPLHNAVIKTAKGDWQKRLADFNRGLALLESRGVLARIVHEHNLTR